MVRPSPAYLPPAMARPKEGTTFIHAAPRHDSIQATTAGLAAAYGPSRPAGGQHPQLLPVHLAQSNHAAQGVVTVMAPRRTRQPIACDPCRASKRKCSGGLPCDSCLRRGPSIVCHYDAASELKVRTRAEMRGRTRGRRGKHIGFRSSAPSVKDTFHLRARDAGRAHHGTIARHAYDHRSGPQTQQQDRLAHMYGAPAPEGKNLPATAYWSPSQQHHYHPHEPRKGDPRTALHTMSYAPHSQQEGLSSPRHLSGRNDLEMDISGTPESTRSDSESNSALADDDGDNDDDDDDDDDDEYMETSPLFRGRVLDRVQLRRVESGKQELSVRDDSRYEKLPARLLPSIDSLLNVSHTRTSARRPQRSDVDEECSPSKVEASVDHMRRTSFGDVNSAPPTPSSEHRLHRGTIVEADHVHSTPGSATSGFTSLPPPHGRDVHRRSPGPPLHGFSAQGPAHLNWSVSRTAPVLPLPRETYQARSCLYAGETSHESPANHGQCSAHCLRQHPHHEARRESGVPDWIKPLPANRLARSHAAQRPPMPNTATSKGSEESRPEPPRHSRYDIIDTGNGRESSGYAMHRGIYAHGDARSHHYPDVTSASDHVDSFKPRYLDERYSDRGLSGDHRVPVSQRRF